MNIHQRMSERYALARVYAEDGAFHSAARILKELAKEVKDHARFCDAAVEGLLANLEARGTDQ